MRRCVVWIAMGLLLVGCQTKGSSPAAREQAEALSPTFEQQALNLTDDGSELVFSKAHLGHDRDVALVIRYSKRRISGGNCTLSIIEQSDTNAVVVESSDQVMSCSGVSVPNAEAVSAGLEASVESDFIRLDEDRFRNRSEYEFTRTPDGRWHLTYSADIGPEEDSASGELVVASYALAYPSAPEAPFVSDVEREAVDKSRRKSIY